MPNLFKKQGEKKDKKEKKKKNGKKQVSFW